LAKSGVAAASYDYRIAPKLFCNFSYARIVRIFYVEKVLN